MTEIDGTVALLFSLNLKDAIAGAPVVWTPILVDLVRTEFNCIDVICRAKAWAKDAAVFTPGEPTTLTSGQTARTEQSICPTCDGMGGIPSGDDFDKPLYIPCPDCSTDRAPTVAHAEVEPTSPGTALPSPTPGQGLTPQQQHAAVPTPDEGGMWGNDNTWDTLAARYKALEAHQIAWIKQLTKDAQTAGVAFHAKGHRTRRRHNLYTAIIGYSEHIEPDDELLRALIAAVVDNDWPLYPIVTVGQAFGALNADEASTLSYVIDQFVGKGFVVHTRRGVLELDAA